MPRLKVASPAPAPETDEREHISAIPLAACKDLGKEGGTILAGREDPRRDPVLLHITAQGRQMLLLESSEHAEAIERARAEVEHIRQTIALVAGQAKATARAAWLHARRAERLRRHAADAQPFFGLPEVPGPLLYLLLAGIALAEWSLNRPSFDVIGDGATATDLLTLVLGVGMVAGAHLAGVGLRRSVDRLPGHSPTVHHLLIAISMLAALGLAAGAVAMLRKAGPTEAADVAFWVALLQVFLLWTATLLSAAHDRPLRTLVAAAEQELEEVEAVRDAWRARWISEHELLMGARARLRTLVTRALGAVEVQHMHNERQVADVALGAQSSTAVPVALAPAPFAPPTWLAQWQGWLEAQPAPTDEAPLFADELERLEASWAHEWETERAAEGAGPAAAEHGHDDVPDPRRISDDSTGTGDAGAKPSLAPIDLTERSAWSPNGHRSAAGSDR